MMTGVLSPGGVPMRMALPIIVSGPVAETLQLYNRLEATEPQSILRPLVQVLWAEVLLSELRGQVCVTGILPDEKRSETLERGLLMSSEPDFQRNTLSSTVGTVTAVLVHDAPVAGTSTPHPVSDPHGAAERWMAEHVTTYKANQRDARVRECRVALGIRKDAAAHGWNTLSEAIRGKPRTPKS